jgi:hypothetical protein
MGSDRGGGGMTGAGADATTGSGTSPLMAACLETFRKSAGGGGEEGPIPGLLRRTAYASLQHDQGRSGRSRNLDGLLSKGLIWPPRRKAP